MDTLLDFLDWAWARHHNALSWYIRPLFVLPFCYFAYKRSIWGVVLTVVAVTSSMFWFPAPGAADPPVTAFLAMERQYVMGPLTLGKAAMTMLVPLWFIVLAWSFWCRSWVGGFIVISVGTVLKVIWSFCVGGESAWAIIPPVALGFIVCAGTLLYTFRRVRHQRGGSTEAQRLAT
jgi:hypothetical protein